MPNSSALRIASHDACGNSSVSSQWRAIGASSRSATSRASSRSAGLVLGLGERRRERARAKRTVTPVSGSARSVPAPGEAPLPAPDAAALFRRNAADPDIARRPAILDGDRVWTHAEYVAEAHRWANLFLGQRVPGKPLHVGVLLDNVPSTCSRSAAPRCRRDGRRPQPHAPRRASPAATWTTPTAGCSITEPRHEPLLEPVRQQARRARARRGGRSRGRARRGRWSRRRHRARPRHAPGR